MALHLSEKSLRADGITASAYHPQSNGLTERFNQTLCKALAKCVQDTEKEWDTLIPSILFAYRTIKHKTTKYEPYYLLYRQTPTLPIELDVSTWPTNKMTDEKCENLLNRRISDIIGRFRDDKIKASGNISKAQQRQKEKHDKKIKSMTYRINDLVLEYRSDLQNVHGDKFRERWTALFISIKYWGMAHIS